MNKKFTLLGIKINILKNYDETFNLIVDSIRDGNRKFITVNNVHTIIEGIRDEKYKEIINNSFLAIPDGKPLSVYAKFKGIKNISRIFGPTFFEETLGRGQVEGIRHYFFGSSRQTLDKMKIEVMRKFSSAIISGTYSPPFREFTSEENESFIGHMNESDADIFWIGLGAPKQEIWMYENYKKLNKGIMIGIGAGFDYLAGNTKHAPKWMKNASLEWLYRLIQEPGRLWKRYLITNTLFLWYVFLELTGLKKFD